MMWSNHATYTDIVGFEFDGTTSSDQNGLINYYNDDGSGACHVLVLANKVHDLCDAGSCRREWWYGHRRN